MAFMILDDLNMSAEEFDWHEKEAFGLISQRKANRQISQHISPEKYPPNADYPTQGSSSALTRKRVEPAISAVPRKKAAQEFTRKKSWSTLVEWELPVYMLFEFATGYALFHARDVDEVERNFKSCVKSCEKYIKHFNEVFTLVAFRPFESAAEALFQMNAISESKVTEELKKFLMLNLPTPVAGKPSYSVVVSDPIMSTHICIETGMPVRDGNFFSDIARGLRMNIDKLIPGLERGYLENAQRDLACSYSRKICYARKKNTSMNASSSFFSDSVIVPHKFEGVFIAMGKDRDAICTKNLVPGESVYGEKFVSAQNEDGTETEYRVWNPFKSKLAAAITSGLNNIWLKPGSRVLYIGDVSGGATVSHLSDIVGHNGLVYAVGLSNAVVNMAEKRSNVIPIFMKFLSPWKYRMLVGMVDVLVADTASVNEGLYASVNAAFFLKAGGHFIISGQASYMDFTSNDKAMFAFLGQAKKREFKPIERVMLKQLEDYAVAVGGFRVLEE